MSMHDSSPYPRENYHGDLDGQAGPDPRDGVRDPSLVNNRDKWVAGKILRTAGSPTLWCPRCWYNDDELAALTEPEHYVPPEDIIVSADVGLAPVTITRYGDHRKHRRCTHCGHVAWGGILQDRPMEAFLEIVAVVLDCVDTPTARREGLLERAKRRKQRDVDDESNMSEVIRELRHGTDD